ncbi:MAG: archease [Acidobacteriia bacterium]|nr:archease [Terriglobia bacterium]
MNSQPGLEAPISAEEVEHVADRAFRVRGRNLAELLEKAAQALVALDEEAPLSEHFVRQVIEVDGSDRETLLVNWLNEILYLEQTHHEFYDHFLLSDVTENHFCAQLYGRQLDHSVTSLKAVTFHNLEVKESSEGLEATVVVDV